MESISTAHLFPPLEAKLLELLRSLSAEDWGRQTLAPAWKVRHVAAHLLDTSLRRLSMVRDGYFATGPRSASAADVAEFVSRANAEGVAVYGRLSAPLLIAWIEVASRELCAHIAALDPSALAVFPVSWAGEAQSLNWFDTAREYTERWHHQQQIREAVHQDGIMTAELYGPVVDTFMRALPFSYRDVHAEKGSAIHFVVTGTGGGAWRLQRADDGWQLTRTPAGNETARIEVPGAIAWRIFTKGISHAEAKSLCRVSGDGALADAFFATLAIVA